MKGRWIFVTALVTGCGGAPDQHDHALPEAMAPVVATEEGLVAGEGVWRSADLAALDLQDGLRTSAWRPLSTTASRVAAVTVGGSAGLEAPGAFQVRAGWSNGQVGPWVDLEVLWSREGAAVLAADLSTAATRLQLRLATGVDAQLVWWRATTPLRSDLRGGTLTSSPPSIPARARDRWGASAPRCGEEDPGDAVVVSQIPLPLTGAMAMKALQSFSQLGLQWCDLDASYYVTSDDVWQGRGTRRPARSAGRRVTVVGCEPGARARARLVDTLQALGAEGAVKVETSELCGDARWLVDAVEAARDTPSSPLPTTPYVLEVGAAVVSAPVREVVTAPPPISAIDHDLLIARWGGADVDPSRFPVTQDGFQDYLTAVGVTYFAAWEYVVPNNRAVAERCGYTLLLPERAAWPKAAALGLLADQLRRLVNEPVTLRNWWRPPCYNEGVGGAAGGDHPDADALDLDFASSASRAAAQRYLCDEFWRKDLLTPEELAGSSGVNPRLNMSIGLGGQTIHLGLLSRRGRRFWKYSSYAARGDEGSCW